MSNIIESLNWRYAVKKFDSSKKVSDENVNIIAESLRLSASSFGLQPWKFVFVSDDNVKKELLAHSWNQEQVVDCSHHIVMCYKNDFSDKDVARFLESTAEARNVPLESLEGFGKMMTGFVSNMDDDQKRQWMKDQVYIALGNLLTTCAQLSVDSCPMEGINQTEYDRILGLDKEGWRTAVACPIGYRSSEDKYADLAKVRYSKDEVIEFR